MNLKNQRSSQKVPRESVGGTPHAAESPFSDKFMAKHMHSTSRDVLSQTPPSAAANHQSQQNSAGSKAHVEIDRDQVADRIAKAMATVGALLQGQRDKLDQTVDLAPALKSASDAEGQTTQMMTMQTTTLRKGTTRQSKKDQTLATDIKEVAIGENSVRQKNNDIGAGKKTTAIRKQEMESTESSQMWIKQADRISSYKPDELLCCSEQLNPEEEITIEQPLPKLPQPKSTLEHKPILQLCLNLPKSVRVNKSTAEQALLKDAASFGSVRGHGLPYLRKQRELKQHSQQPMAPKLKLKSLLDLPCHLLTTHDRFYTEASSNPNLKHQVTQEPLTRNYLKSGHFSHVFNIKPTFGSQCQLTDNKSQLPIEATSATTQVQPIQQLQPQFSSHNQTQQIAQRRHLLSKRTRVSAQSTSNLTDCINNDQAACLTNTQNALTEGLPNHNDSQQLLPTTLLKRFKTSDQQQSSNSSAQLFQQKSDGGVSKMTFSTQASYMSLARSQSDMTMTHPHNKMLNAKSSVVIENDSKEVLLRMFEHLISEEQRQDEIMKEKSATTSGGCKAKRSAKLMQMKKHRAVVNDFLVLNLDDEGIKSTEMAQSSVSSTSAALASTTADDEAQRRGMMIGRDGVYRIQFEVGQMMVASSSQSSSLLSQPPQQTSSQSQEAVPVYQQTQ